MKTRAMLTGLLAAPLAVALFAGVAYADTLNRQLEQGMSGTDVGALQTFLALDNTIYPQGLVTNFFGPLTFAAVSNFQSRNGIATVGRVGPITLAAINAQMSGSASSNAETTYAEGAGKATNLASPQPIISNVAVTTTTNTATVTWNSSVAATGKVWYSTNPAYNYNSAPSATSPNVSTSESVAITGLQGNTVYYYTVESLDPQGNFSWSPFGAWFKTQ